MSRSTGSSIFGSFKQSSKSRGAERFHRGTDHRDDVGTHLVELLQQALARGQLLGREIELRDVHRLIPDPLQMKTDVQDGRHEPELCRHRRLQREHLQQIVVDREIQVVDRIIFVDDALRLGVVVLHECFDGALNRRRSELPHGEELAAPGARADRGNAPGSSEPPRDVILRRWSDGFVKIVSVRSNSTMCPVRCPSSATSTVKKAVRSETRAACCMLWVTITIVYSETELRIRSSILAVAIGSSAEHGSSIRITSGRVAIARAMQRRCCWPPESAIADSFSLSLHLVPERRLAQ